MHTRIDGTLEANEWFANFDQRKLEPSEWGRDKPSLTHAQQSRIRVLRHGHVEPQVFAQICLLVRSCTLAFPVEGFIPSCSRPQSDCNAGARYDCLRLWHVYQRIARNKNIGTIDTDEVAVGVTVNQDWRDTQSVVCSNVSLGKIHCYI